jgi:hypothetical protein
MAERRYTSNSTSKNQLLFTLLPMTKLYSTEDNLQKAACKLNQIVTVCGLTISAENN